MRNRFSNQRLEATAENAAGSHSLFDVSGPEREA